MARPVARIGDMVYFPKCGVYPIVSGGPWIDQTPVAHIGDVVACPTMGIIISGAMTFIDAGRPVARIGDIVVSPKCKIGIIISGDPMFIQGP